MLLYLMRHGIAEHVAGSAEIELTEEGKQIVRRTLEVASSFGIAKPTRIYSSPLKRARQTAQIAQEVVGCDEVLVAKPLTPETDAIAALTFIASLEHREPTLLVGHDPLFSTLASILVAGTDIPVVEMKKSSICVVELTRFEVPRMRGVLRLFLPPTTS